jgi:hypothetical protein
MATLIYNSMTDHSVLDGTNDAINGAEVDVNPNTIAQIADGTTQTDFATAGTVDFLFTSSRAGLRLVSTDNAAGAIYEGLVIEWDPGDGAQMTDNSSGVSIQFKMPDSLDNQDTYAEIVAICLDDATTSEDGELSFRVSKAGTVTEIFTVGSTQLTVGADDDGFDFKWFGDTASAYLLWDTSADKLLTAGGATIDIVKDKLLIGGTAVTTTAAELNLIDGGTARGTDAVSSGDGILINDGGTTKMTNVDTVSTYFASHSVGGTNIATVGTITSGTWSGVIDGSATMTLGSDATGDIYYRDASGFLERLAASTDGYVLTATGAGSIPAWEAVSAGVSLSGTTNNTVATVTGANALIGEANLTFDGSTLNVIGNAGIGLARTDGTLHVHTASAGTIAAESDFNDLVIENSGNCGISILSPAANTCGIYFGDPVSASAGAINYLHSSDAFAFATAGSERMRITSDGYLLVGKNAVDITAAGVQFDSNGRTDFTVSGATVMAINRTSNTGQLVTFRYANTEYGSVSTDGSNVAFNTSSDYRLKENIVDLTGAVTRLKNLQPRRFNFREIPDVTKDGFIAHEASAIVPEAVTGTKDGTETLSNVIVGADGIVLAEDQTETAWISGKKSELVSKSIEAVDAVLYVDGDEITEGKSIGDVKTPAIEAAEAVYTAAYASDTVWHETLTVPKYQGIDQAKLVPLLTAAIQELVTRVEALEAA